MLDKEEDEELRKQEEEDEGEEDNSGFEESSDSDESLPEYNLEDDESDLKQVKDPCKYSNPENSFSPLSILVLYINLVTFHFWFRFLRYLGQCVTYLRDHHEEPDYIESALLSLEKLIRAKPFDLGKGKSLSPPPILVDLPI